MHIQWCRFVAGGGGLRRYGGGQNPSSKPTSIVVVCPRKLHIVMLCCVDRPAGGTAGHGIAFIVLNDNMCTVQFCVLHYRVVIVTTMQVEQKI